MVGFGGGGALEKNWLKMKEVGGSDEKIRLKIG